MTAINSVCRFAAHFSISGALIMAVLFSGGCASTDVRVAEADNEEITAYGDEYGGSSLRKRTRNVLANLLLTDESPETVVKKLSRYYQEEKNTVLLPVLSDFCWNAGINTDDSDLAMRYFLSAALFSYGYLAAFDRPEDNVYNPMRIEQMWIYNQSLTRFYLYLQSRGLGDSSDYNIELLNGVKVHFSRPEYELPWPRERYKNIFPCAAVKISNLRLDSYRFGIGCPLVLETGMEQKHFPAGSTMPATLLLQFEKPSDGGRKIEAKFRYLDVLRSEQVSLPAGRGKVINIPLTLDFSTPLAYRVNKPLQFGDLLYMLRPDSTSAQEGLYLLEPYQPDKIPVVFVHGLMSSLHTWLQMINTLYADPVLRERFQFWGFTYSSGNPVLYSAGKFRKALSGIREEAAAKGSLENFDNMVLIGHSMGGLVCKTAAMNPDGRLYQEFFSASKEEVRNKLTDKQRVMLDEMIDFKKLDFVKRIVFLAVPHRGSDWADSSIGALGVNLIRLPVGLLTNGVEITEGVGMMLRNAGGLFTEKKHPYIRTGIENLDPDDPVMKALLKLPILVPYHTVSGNRREHGVPGGSDGIVDYSSSHLDGAESELVVKSSHSVQQQPLAIHEIQRILHQHLEETDAAAVKSRAVNVSSGTAVGKETNSNHSSEGK